MTTVVKRSSASPLAELLDWVETGWPTAMDWRRGQQALRIEDRLEDDKYVLRAEVPGIDPDKDVEISVADNVLSITAERQEAVSDKGRSEFHYGSFVRRVSLPKGAREEQMSASYRDGILEITVPIEASAPTSRTIPISREASD